MTQEYNINEKYFKYLFFFEIEYEKIEKNHCSAGTYIDVYMYNGGIYLKKYSQVYDYKNKKLINYVRLTPTLEERIKIAKYINEHYIQYNERLQSWVRQGLFIG